MKPMRTTSRKKDHVDITISQDVSFRTKTTGFERWDFLHNALPELDYDEIDPSSEFLGKKISFPLIISSMTGGYKDALRINKQLAEICEEKGIALGVGSQRQALENKVYHRTFSVVREVAPTIPVFGNIGAAEVADLKSVSAIQKLVELVRADGFAVHLNPLQELLQPEGNTKFRGVLNGIETLVKELPVPVIVKEIGAGISGDVARRLLNAGVRIIDVAGAGGTSWAGVELIRRTDSSKRRKSHGRSLEDERMMFWDWGIPTTDALQQVAAMKEVEPALTIISSGGIANGLDIAKSIALGADVSAAARPFLMTLVKKGKNRLRMMIDMWEAQFRGAMFLTGSQTVAHLRNQKLVPRI